MDVNDVARDSAAPPRTVALLRLLYLASPTLPIGAFAYSQGLEPAVAAGLVHDEPTARAWIVDLLVNVLTFVDLPVFARVHAAVAAGDVGAAQRWDAHLLASRATAELQAEDLHLGTALARVLDTPGLESLPPMAGSVPRGEPRSPIGDSAAAAAAALDADADADADAGGRTYCATFARASVRYAIDCRSAMQAFAFNWAQAQTSAAVRLIPLGQSAGLRILAAAITVIPGVVDRSLEISDDDIGAAAPQLAMLSADHETQYSRLFRS